MKTRLAFIVTIEGPGGFRDQIVSLKPNVVGAVKDGLRWYRHAASDPGRGDPAIKAERTQVLADPRARSGR